MQRLSKASSVLPTSRRLCYFRPILVLHLIVPAISGNVSAWSTTFELIKRCVGPFQPWRPSAPVWWETLLRSSICVVIFLSALKVPRNWPNSLLHPPRDGVLRHVVDLGEEWMKRTGWFKSDDGFNGFRQIRWSPVMEIQSSRMLVPEASRDGRLKNIDTFIFSLVHFTPFYT